MLELLHIENIAVIEEADIQFRPGFNALTGETGAGKSIVIDAMNAVLGGRTSRDLIRTGTDKAFVSAAFSSVPAELAGLAECGVSPDENGELLLQRELTADGKNYCRANGRPITVAQMKRIGSELLNIHGQHDGTALLDEEQHGAYLDRFGRVEEPFAAYRAAYDCLADLRSQIRALQMDEAEKARRMDSLRFQIGELELAELVAGEHHSGGGQSHKENLPPYYAEYPQSHKGGEKARPHRDYGQQDYLPLAVAGLFHLLIFFNGRFPFIVRGEQIIHAYIEKSCDLREHIGVGYSFPPLPFGNGLVGVVELCAQLRLSQVGFSAKSYYIAG